MSHSPLMHSLSKSNRNFTTKNPKFPSSNCFHRATIPSLSLSGHESLSFKTLLLCFHRRYCVSSLCIFFQTGWFENGEIWGSLRRWELEQMWIVPRNWRNKQAEGTILGSCCWRGKERASNGERRGEEMNAWLLQHRHQHHLHHRHILKCDNCGAPLEASVFFFSHNFVRYVLYRSFTRGLSQIWLKFKEESSLFFFLFARHD